MLYCVTRLTLKLCPTPGRALNFFSGRGVRPRFPKCGARELIFASEKGGLWTENFQIWGLFPNLRACELKISKFWGLWAKIWVKIEAVEAKISKFSQKGVLWTDSFAWNGTLANYRRGVKRGFSGPHIPIPPFLVQCPPPGARPSRYFFNEKKTLNKLKQLKVVQIKYCTFHKMGRTSK